jgi:hypothetical protein
MPEAAPVTMTDFPAKRGAEDIGANSSRFLVETTSKPGKALREGHWR